MKIMIEIITLKNMIINIHISKKLHLIFCNFSICIKRNEVLMRKWLSAKKGTTYQSDTAKIILC